MDGMETGPDGWMTLIRHHYLIDGVSACEKITFFNPEGFEPDTGDDREGDCLVCRAYVKSNIRKESEPKG